MTWTVGEMFAKLSNPRRCNPGVARSTRAALGEPGQK